MSEPKQPTPDEIAAAVKVLQAAGVVVSLPAPQRSLSVQGVCDALGVGRTYVRTHMRDFPGAWRLPGGELRIPVADLIALEKRGRLFSRNGKVSEVSYE